MIGRVVGVSQIILLSWNLFLLLVVTLSFFLLFDAVFLFVAFPCVHHYEHLVFAFVSVKVCLIIFLLPIKKKRERSVVLESSI